MWQSFSLLLLATACVCQQRQPARETGDRQIRLEDIERDNLAANQKPVSAPATSQTQPAQSSGVTQQQLAAYQQQLLLQQLQQQYFAPSPFAYNGLGGVVPLMIIPSNHLGAGSPIQAYFVPTDPQFFPQYQPQLYQPTPVSHRYQQPQRVQSVPRVQTLPQEFAYIQPSVSQTYRPQAQNYPSASVVYAGTPTASYLQPQQQAYQQQQTYQQQNGQQQLYNAYNALYQQQQGKDSFAAGVKSTPSPPIKPHSPQQSGSQAYSNFKSFN